MFWQLLLAHFIADYPLQTDSLVKSKRYLNGLTLHVSIHFIIMLVIVSPAWAIAWFYLLLLTVIHFGLDFGKTQFSKHKPDWVIFGYLMDQVFHISSVWLIAYWLSSDTPISLFINPTWAIYGIGYLWVSTVWFITERILNYKNKRYQQEINQQHWSRMLMRVVFLTILLTCSEIELIAIILATGTIFQWPYLQSQYRRRALLTDISVVFMTWGFIQLAQ